MIRWIGTFIIILSLAGCDKQQRPWDTLSECERENTDLTLHVQQLQNENTKLTEQLETSLGLEHDARLEAISTLQTVRIGKRTGFFDKDQDGTIETLVVYLEPKDTAQDSIKAPGQVTVELWDLKASEDNAQQSKWTVEPARLHTSWGGTIFHSYYRIKLPLEIVPEQGKEYTLKINFTDYLTGKVLTDQKVIQP